MAVHGPGLDASFKSGANLNTTTSDWQPVRISSAGSVNLANTTTQRVIGVLQNRPKTGTGAACVVRSVGFSKLAMNDTCSAGDLVVRGAGGAVRGTGLSATINRSVIGRATEASAASGTVINVLLTPGVALVGDTTTAVNVVLD